MTAERLNGNTDNGARPVTKAYHAALAYELTGNLGVKLGHRHFALDRTAAPRARARANTWWAGANYRMTPAIDLTAVLYYQDIKAGVTPSDTAADPMMLVARARYALSKRTSLYATVARAQADEGIPIGLSRDPTEDGGVTGLADRQTGVMLGLQHRF